MHIGISIRNIRKKRTPKLTQQEFCKLAGITQTYLSQIETGVKTPTIGVLESISKNLGVPLPILFWFGLQEEDIIDGKKKNYRFLKPTIDAMINEFF